MFIDQPRARTPQASAPHLGTNFPWSNGAVRIVTTSWDDGVIHDLKVAELLESHGMAGTFYVPVSGRFHCPPMNYRDWKALSNAGFEIGAHGFFHRILPECSRRDLKLEIEGSKLVLEDFLGKEVRMFAYPRGRYSREVLDRVKAAGYLGARTTRVLSHVRSFDCFRMPTSVQVYPHVRSSYLRNVLREAEFTRTRTFLAHFGRLTNWTDLGKALFDEVLTSGGIWHLYGHSWEIDALGLWNELSDVLDYVSGREGVLYLANGRIVDSLDPPTRDHHRHAAVPAI